MDPPIPSLFGRVTAVLGEHASLHGRLKRLRTLCANLATDKRATDEEPEQAVREFLIDLQKHFITEESDEYFGLLVNERPALRAQVDRLRAEHRAMTEDGARIQAAFSGDGPKPGLAADLVRLLDTLETHERTENLLLQEFFSRDEGGG